MGEEPIEEDPYEAAFKKVAWRHCETRSRCRDANVVYKWKRQLLDNAAQSFETDHGDGGASEREDVEAAS